MLKFIALTHADGRIHGIGGMAGASSTVDLNSSLIGTEARECTVTSKVAARTL